MFDLFFRPYVPGFRVRPHDDVPGFNIDENGLFRRTSAWSDGMLPAVTQWNPDAAQAERSHSIGFPTPSSETVVQTAPPIGLGSFRRSPRTDVPNFNVTPRDDVPRFNLNEDDMLSQFPVVAKPSQPASPQLPEWLGKLTTTLPPLLTILDPLTGRHVVISSPPGMPSTEQPVARQWPSSGLPKHSADMNIRSRVAAMRGINAQPAQSATSNAWSQPRNTDWPYGQSARLSSPWNTGITRQPIGISPIPGAGPFEGSNSILTDTTGAVGPWARRQTPLPQYQAMQPSSSLGTAAPSSNGPSLGQRLVQSSVETIVPGAHYQNLARQQLRSGNYIGAGVYQAAAFLDAALGAATLGLSTRLGAASRAAAGQGAALFRRAFDSKSRLFGYLGHAPKDMHWHHIVEQSQAAKFGQRAIQSVDNIVAIPIEAHRRLNGFYSSKQSFSEPKTVREWLRGESFEAQYEFGMRQLKRVLGY